MSEPVITAKPVEAKPEDFTALTAATPEELTDRLAVQVLLPAVATSVSVPDAVDGIDTVVEKLPSLPVETEPAELPPSVSDTFATPPKPEPITVALEPGVTVLLDDTTHWFCGGYGSADAALCHEKAVTRARTASTSAAAVDTDMRRAAVIDIDMSVLPRRRNIPPNKAIITVAQHAGPRESKRKLLGTASLYPAAMGISSNSGDARARILVTGGAGYIGSVVTARLLAVGHEVVVVDDLSTGHVDAVPSGAQFHQRSIAELGGVLGEWSIDAVIHFAAKSLVGESVTNPALYWHNNVGGTLALLDAMRAHGVAKIVFSSSAGTYGEVQESPISETAPTRPASPYGASKLAIDLALTDYAHAYGLNAVSLRYFNVAGALFADGAGYGERHTTETHLIPLALRAADGAAPALTVFGTDYPTPDGTCVRDYIHVVDLADAHLRALNHLQAQGVGAAGEHQIVNLGSGSGYSVRQVLDAVRAVTGRELPVHEAGRRAGDPATSIAANAKALSLLGWRPERDLHQMVSDAWEFYRRTA
jgi:UDP-glucose 4-epimerase